MGKKDKNHFETYVNAKGERVMRVSTVINKLAKDQIAIWANMLGFKHIDYKKELERTANIGSLVHYVIEGYTNPKRLAIIDYEEFNVTDYGSRIEVRNAIDSFMKWYDRIKDKYHVKHTELVVVGETLGGTIDCVIEGFKDPNKVIFVDYKTSSDFYMTQFLQLAAYVIIYEEVYGKHTVEGVMVCQLDKKHANMARAKFLPRKKMNLFIQLFQSLHSVAWCVDMLNKNYGDLLDQIM